MDVKIWIQITHVLKPKDVCSLEHWRCKKKNNDKRSMVNKMWCETYGALKQGVNTLGYIYGCVPKLHS